MQFLRHYWLLLTAAVSGAVVMAVEILGARLLSVAFGGSLAVWAAMIAVTLIALATGYFVGGRVADRYPRPAVLFGVLLAASVLAALCPYARPTLSIFAVSLGIRSGALLASLALFALPLGLMGITSPYVIRLLTRDPLRAGRTAGSVYAVSTLGSVAGTLLTGLWLVAAVGCDTGFRVAAGALAVVAATGWALHRPRSGIGMWILALAIPLLPARALPIGATFAAADGDPVTVLAVRDSRYGRLAVLRKGNHRLLVTDGIVQTGVPLSITRFTRTEALANQYFQELIPYTVSDPAGRSALIIGLAGGMTATLLGHYDIDVYAVDIDPAVIELAREFFWFDAPAEAADGRQVLQTRTNRYDFCVLDTYSGDVFPAHLCSREAFAAARRVLTDDGVLAVNFIGSPTGKPFACIWDTLASVFPHVRALRGEDGDDVQTITLFAAMQPVEFSQGWLRYSPDFRGVDPISDMIHRFAVEPAHAGGFVLTDNYNPIDFLRASEALRWRERTVSVLGPRVASL